MCVEYVIYELTVRCAGLFFYVPIVCDDIIELYITIVFLFYFFYRVVPNVFPSVTASTVFVFFLVSGG